MGGAARLVLAAGCAGLVAALLTLVAETSVGEKGDTAPLEVYCLLLPAERPAASRTLIRVRNPGASRVHVSRDLPAEISPAPSGALGLEVGPAASTEVLVGAALHGGVATITAPDGRIQVDATVHSSDGSGRRHIDEIPCLTSPDERVGGAGD